MFAVKRFKLKSIHPTPSSKIHFDEKSKNYIFGRESHLSSNPKNSLNLARGFTKTSKAIGSTVLKLLY